jgi:hypothetical protein
MQGENMKNFPYWLPILAWSAISLALQAPDLRARPADGSNVVDMGGLKSQAPANWVEEKPDDAQAYKQYRLEPVNDDKDYAQLTVSFQGKGKGDTAAAFVKRWKAMFLPSEGKTMHDAAKMRQLTANGAAVTYLDVHGDYKGIPGDDTTPRQNFRLLGVYLDTSKGPYIIRLFGPADTVEFYRTGFEDWLKALK